MSRGGTGNTRNQSVLSEMDDFSITFGPEDAIEEESGPDFWTPGRGRVHEAEQFEAEYAVDTAVGLALLRNARGRFKTVYDFYHPAGNHLVPDPEKVMPGMRAAGKDLYAHIQAGETIAIFGDYDPDGTTGVETLRRAIAHYVDDERLIIRHARGGRFGLTAEFVQYAHDQGATVLITVDCGSADVEQVRFAQSLGMKVIVVDHHLAEEDVHNPDKNNPAEHHLNPQLTGTSELTGSPLAWHLGRSLHRAAGSVPDEYYGAPMFLAGFGLQADRGRLDTLEHRALIWSPQLRHGERVVPIGMVVLAEMLAADDVINSEDHIADPNNRVIMAAAMNASKRYDDASADEVGRMLSARNRAEAAKPAKRILADYKKVKLAKEAITQEILLPELERQMAEDLVLIDAYTERRAGAQKELTAARGALTRAQKAYDSLVLKGSDEDALAKAEAKIERARERVENGEQSLAAATSGRVERGRYLHSVLVNDERFQKFRGTAGLLAPFAVKQTGKASIVGVVGPRDEANGEPLVKFRMNVPTSIEREAKKEADENERTGSNKQSRQNMLPGRLRKDEKLRELCSFIELDHEGQEREVSAVGGHPPLLSGTCRLSQWDAVVGHLEQWATEVSGRNGNNWHVERKEQRHEAYPLVRLSASNSDVKRLGRIETQANQYGPIDFDHGHRPFQVSIPGTIENEHVDENGYRRARLILGPNDSREVFISRNAKKELPAPGQQAEFVLEQPSGSRYVLSVWHVPGQ
jgi:hypothetical protein